MSEERPAMELQVARVTGIPALTTTQFRQLFTSLASKLRGNTGSRFETSKQVRDECTEAEVPVGRSAIHYVIQALLYAGVPLHADSTPEELATIWTRNVESLCRGARMEFNEAEASALRAWVSGGLTT